MAAVMRPKLAGAWNLHRLTRAADLAFFVLFSSASSLLGLARPGQLCGGERVPRHARPCPPARGSARAERELGAVGGDRRSRSARRHGTETIWATQGVGSLDPDQGIEALELAMAQSSPQIAILPIDWPRLADAPAPFAAWPMLPACRRCRRRP